MEKEILTMEEAAELFGVSIKTFIKLLKEEKVPARKIGREWRFSRKALIDWLSCGDSQTYSASDSETKEYFNQIAQNWEEIRKGYYDESIVNELKVLKLLKKPMTLVDLGAGNGYISLEVATEVKKVIAVDISKEMLHQIERNAQENGIKNIHTLESYGHEIPLGDKSVDMVCGSMYLHHVESPKAAIMEMGRVLKYGGHVFLADYYEHKDMELLEKMHDIWPGFNDEKLKSWFLASGFKEVSVKELSNSNKKTSKISPQIFILTAKK